MSVNEEMTLYTVPISKQSSFRQTGSLIKSSDAMTRHAIWSSSSRLVHWIAAANEKRLWLVHNYAQPMSVFFLRGLTNAQETIDILRWCTYWAEIYGGWGRRVRTGFSETQGAGPLEAGNKCSAVGINKFCNWTPERNWHLAVETWLSVFFFF